MQDRQLYQQILGITAPWSVERVELKLDKENAVRVFLKHAKNIEWKCAECGASCPLHDHEPARVWRHLDTCQYQTLLHTSVPRTKCPEHGVLVVQVPWAEANTRFTLLFERLVINWMLESDRTAVARMFDISWDQANRIMQKAVERGLLRREPWEGSLIGVDEKSFQAHHEYVTVVCDLEKGHVLHVGDHRKQATLDAFYVGLNTDQKQGIQAVAMDMWEPYIQSTTQLLPNAAIVFDKFHIAKNFSKAVDQVRRAENKRLRAEGDDRLQGTRYQWLTNPTNFTNEAWRDFKDLRTSKLRTARAWALKETFSTFWKYTYAGSARKFFRDWYRWAIRSRLKPIKGVARMLKKRLPQLLNYFKYRITNATAESLNSKIQWIKYMSRGFRSREGFRRAILFHCGGLNLHPELPATK